MQEIDVLNDKLLPLTPVEGYATSVQKITGKKSNTVIRWAKRVMPCVKIGGSWYTTEHAFREACQHTGGDQSKRPQRTQRNGKARLCRDILRAKIY